MLCLWGVLNGVESVGVLYDTHPLCENFVSENVSWKSAVCAFSGVADGRPVAQSVRGHSSVLWLLQMLVCMFVCMYVYFSITGA